MLRTLIRWIRSVLHGHWFRYPRCWTSPLMSNPSLWPIARALRMTCLVYRCDSGSITGSSSIGESEGRTYSRIDSWVWIYEKYPQWNCYRCNSFSLGVIDKQRKMNTWDSIIIIWLNSGRDVVSTTNWFLSNDHISHFWLLRKPQPLWSFYWG